MPFLGTRRVIDIPGADAVIQAAEARAAQTGARVVIAVVDPSGELVAPRRTAGAQIASSRVAVDKPRTAAIFVRPSREIEEQVRGGRLGALALHGAAALTGGIPLKIGDEVVGAIGTSGERPDEDEAISLAGAAAAFTTETTHTITHAGARMAAETAGAAADARGVSPVISVVDAGGALVYPQRPGRRAGRERRRDDRQGAHGSDLPAPEPRFEEQAPNGRPSALHLARAVRLQGGMPIIHDGEIVGAIGVSGASSADEDQELAEIGSRPAARRPSRRVPSAHGGRAGGGLLLDAPAYKLDAGRRAEPSEVDSTKASST